jgi:4-hydroxy-3-methylbut-2-en-1-yl diphosphate synthase IspG/GcpE
VELKEMAAWPKNAVITLVALIVFFTLALFRVYTETRAAYKAVGINDGQIGQRENTLQKIRQIVPVQDCDRLSPDMERIEFLSVKTETLYIVKAGDFAVQVCE